MSVSCPLCGSPASPAFTTQDRNRHASAAEFRYRRCTGCRVIFLENVPEDLGAHYTGGYHRVPAASELEEWSGYEAYKLDIVRRFLSTGEIVDIGSSYGAFPYLASRAGFAVTAIEVDPGACAFIEGTLGLRAIQSAAPETALRDEVEQVDAVTLWHSLEHLRQPWLTIEAAARRLRPGGLLFVATPNPDGLQASLLKARWTHVDAPRHLFLLPRGALLDAARRSGLRPVMSTSTDVETLRCNRTGWQQGLRELGLRFPGVWWLGAGVAAVARPLERGVDNGSAYLVVLERR